MQTSYMLRTIAFQKALRESPDPQRFAETVARKQIEELSNEQSRGGETTRCLAANTSNHDESGSSDLHKGT